MKGKFEEALEVTCPFCHSIPGVNCHRLDRRISSTVHNERLRENNKRKMHCKETAYGYISKVDVEKQKLLGIDNWGIVLCHSEKEAMAFKLGDEEVVKVEIIYWRKNK